MVARRKLIIGAVLGLTVIAIGAGVGVAAGGDGGEALRGNAYDRATAAALAAVGEGTVTEAERNEGGVGYEVEIRRSDGTEVEVRLDDSFKVTRTGSDDGPNEGEEGREEGED